MAVGLSGAGSSALPRDGISLAAAADEKAFSEAAAKAYEVSNLMTYVPKTQRPILMHGTADDNVYFFHTLKLSDALFRAGKQQQVLPLANFTHMVREPVVMERQWEWIARYFRDSL